MIADRYTDSVRSGVPTGILGPTRVTADEYAKQACDGPWEPSEAEIAEKLARQERQRALERSFTLVNLAQQLENIREQLRTLGFNNDADRIDTMVVSLIQQWTIERPR